MSTNIIRSSCNQATMKQHLRYWLAKGACVKNTSGAKMSGVKKGAVDKLLDIAQTQAPLVLTLRCGMVSVEVSRDHNSVNTHQEYRYDVHSVTNDRYSCVGVGRPAYYDGPVD